MLGWYTVRNAAEFGEPARRRCRLNDGSEDLVVVEVDATARMERRQGREFGNEVKEEASFCNAIIFDP